MTVPSDKLFCFGFGYVAERLSNRLMKSHWSISGTARTAEKAQEINSKGTAVSGIVFQNGILNELPAPAAHWLISIPPDDQGCPAYRAAQAAARGAKSITYLSTTGVYGDHQGAWVTEKTAPSPQSDRAKRRIVAEQQWQSVDAHIVRLPGIYGPGRSAFDRLRAGTARRIIKPGQVFSRAHVDDIASGLLAILHQQPRAGVFHFCDDEPAPPQDVIAYAANLLGLEVPPDIPFTAPELSEMTRSFYAECKRVSNTATKRRLNWQPHYPSYREGLAAILSQEAST